LFAYVTNYGSNNVSVISTATNSVTATISVGTNPYGIAITPSGSLAYVTNYGSASISVITLATNTVATTFTVIDNPTAIAIAPNGNYAYFTRFGNALSVLYIGSPASGPNVPQAAMQAYVPAEGETCGDSAPPWVNWPGIITLQHQGWSASWQQWPNNGAGGRVCVRQPYYTTSENWAVQ
jgi:YVTN family beta-propeller protein